MQTRPGTHTYCPWGNVPESQTLQPVELSPHKIEIIRIIRELLDREPSAPVTRIIKCANPPCGKPCQEGTIACQRPVVTYANPSKLALESIIGALSEDGVLADEAENAAEFKTFLLAACDALVAGDLEGAEIGTERTVELFADLQARAFLKTKNGRHGCGS